MSVNGDPDSDLVRQSAQPWATKVAVWALVFTVYHKHPWDFLYVLCTQPSILNNFFMLQTTFFSTNFKFSISLIRGFLEVFKSFKIKKVFQLAKTIALKFAQIFFQLFWKRQSIIIVYIIISNVMSLSNLAETHVGQLHYFLSAVLFNSQIRQIQVPDIWICQMKNMIILEEMKIY